MSRGSSGDKPGVEGRGGIMRGEGDGRRRMHRVSGQLVFSQAGVCVCVMDRCEGSSLVEEGILEWIAPPTCSEGRPM